MNVICKSDSGATSMQRQVYACDEEGRPYSFHMDRNEGVLSMSAECLAEWDGGSGLHGFMYSNENGVYAHEVPRKQLHKWYKSEK